ncbi:Uncharacterised protein [Streptococcus dysgalactiae subsp. equisimilis]|nr:Uncharacterised protein [Streptococcus dysgalactiae subsp. equisimilis]
MWLRSEVEAAVQSPSQSEMASRNSQGVWANSAIISTDMAVPTRVPSRRNRPFATTMPDSGWDTISTVISAHCGCSRSKRKAHHNARPPARSVLMANLSASVEGARNGFQ